DIWIRRVVRQPAGLAGETRVVAVHPRARRLRRDELEAERAHAPLPRARDRLDVRARDPERRVRLLARLRDDVAGREIEELAVELDRVLGEARNQHPHRLLPDLTLVAHAPAEWMELDGPLPLAQPQLDAAAGQKIQRGDAL